MPWLTPETVVALAGAASGGIFVKLLDAHYRIKEKGMDEGSVLRGELHTRVTELTDQLAKSNARSDEWRDRYYRLFAHAAILHAQAQTQRQQLAEATHKPVPELPQYTEDPPNDIHC